MCWDAQTVIWLRSMRIAQGGALAEIETTRMITEKVAARAEAQVATTAATLRGSKKHRVVKKALGVDARRVSSNRRRNTDPKPGALERGIGANMRAKLKEFPDQRRRLNDLLARKATQSGHADR